MGLVNPIPFIKKAEERGVAIASFNVHNMETIQAVAEAAAEERTPVIIQTTPGTLKHAGIPYIAACCKVASELYDVPIALHVDHCPDYATIVNCVRCGYTSIMIDASKLPYEQNIALVQKVVELCHSAGIAVEGELGKIGGVEDDLSVDEMEETFTVPSEAADFVQRTQIDTLAIAIGTAHGLYKGEPKLDFERLSQIRAAVSLPLVLHGASGVPDDSIKRAISLGISKINIATELKIPMANAIRARLGADPDENDPRNYMGDAKKAVKEMAQVKIRLCGATGLADAL